MSIWKITDEGPVKVPETGLRQEKLLEERLEQWVTSHPELLGEPLLVIGRQVTIPDVKDRIDVLALDPEGKAVIIELKRGQLRDPVDVQALRYASYVSKWGFADFENQARAYLGKTGEPGFNFLEHFGRFCADSGIDDVPDLNGDQRLVIVGCGVRDKLGSVALWLRSHNVDIKVIEVQVFREGQTLLLQPQTIVPWPVGRFKDIGRPPMGELSQPWTTDGRTWHLEKRCSAKTKEMFIMLDDIIRDNLAVDGPRWDQKFYVAYRVGNYNWLAVETNPNSLRLDFLVKTGSFDQAGLAQRLSVEEFKKEDSLSDKLDLPSSVQVQNRTDTTDRVRLRIKEGFALESKEFLEFLKEAQRAFPK